MDIVEFYKHNDVDYDFDENYYLDKYPETKNFYEPYCTNNNINNKQRLFFHYIQYHQKKFNSSEYCLEEDLEIDNYGCHIFSYEQCEVGTNLHFRQLQAFNSYAAYKHPNITIYNTGDHSLQNTNIIDIDIPSKSDCLLNNLLSIGVNSVDDNDYIIFTNSDCYIESMFYEFILSSKYSYIEFFRSEMVNHQFVSLHKHGIDGFAIKKYEYLRLLDRNLIPDSLVIGAPYWDTILSNICQTYIKNTYQDLKRLKHIKHSRRWNFYDLNTSGQHNLAQLNFLYDNNIIHNRKIEIISANLVVKIVDHETDYQRIQQTLNTNSSFDYNYLFIEQYNNQKKLTDANLGSTVGSRYHLNNNEDQKEKIIEIIKSHAKKHTRIAVVDQYEIINEKTPFMLTEHWMKQREHSNGF